MFAIDMKWMRTPIQPELLSGLKLPTQQLMLCIYINHLWNDHGLFCKRIMAKTIKHYILDVAGLLAMSDDRCCDVRKDDPTSKSMGQFITRMYAQVDRFETAKNRREPFTLPMLRLARERARLAPWEDHIDIVLADWYEVCLFTGARKSEWAQPDERATLLDNYQRNIFGDAYAFCMRDLRIETKTHERRSGLACLDFPASDVNLMWITYRAQKNGNNGEERLYAASKGELSFIDAMYRILHRFRRLCPSDAQLHNPLAVHRAHGPSGPVHFVTPKPILKSMRSLAAEIYHLDPVKDKDILRCWTSHSLRVAACVLLQEAGFTATQIKWLLRWRSDAFMDYLRNLPGLSQQQSYALNKLSGIMPFIFDNLGVMRDEV